MNTTLKSNPKAPSSAETTPANDRGSGTQMKALVYNGRGQIKLQDCSKPVIKGLGDAIVRVTQTTICGTDLHCLTSAPMGQIRAIA